ncbi:hypothetical protein [Priestia koreensis]|uniref:hypothetical protein n=1 Tax=Priestia koreensis TaxID=284581 RepID=UPI001F55F86B|nr:hypothetical protein [Priestia koreensis]UNL86749.1 hypothetical protein IE339_09750 [Priestia koreensis]
METKELLLAITELKSSLDRRFDALEKHLDKRFDEIDEQLYRVNKKLHNHQQDELDEREVIPLQKNIQSLQIEMEYVGKLVGECDRKLFRLEKQISTDTSS